MSELGGLQAARAVSRSIKSRDEAPPLGHVMPYFDVKLTRRKVFLINPTRVTACFGPKEGKFAPAPNDLA